MRPILSVAFLVFAAQPAGALHIPTPTQCICITGGFAGVKKPKLGKDCDIVCQSTIKKPTKRSR